MRRWLPIVLVLIALLGCPQAGPVPVPARPRPSAAPLRPTPPVRTAAGPTPEEARWQALAFGAATAVLVVEVGAPLADEPGAMDRPLLASRVLEELRGYRSSATLPLAWFSAAPGTRWIVALETHDRSWQPFARVLAAVPDTPAERARVLPLITPPWRYTPVVAIVTLEPPDPLHHFVVYAVEHVLAGDMPTGPWLDRELPRQTAVDMPAGPRRYLLTAWGQPDRNYGGTRYVGEALTPLDQISLPAVERELAAHPRAALEQRVADSQATLARLTTAWRFHAAPQVVDGDLVANPPRYMNSLDGFSFVVRRFLRALPAGASATVRGAFNFGLGPGGRVLEAVNGRGEAIEELRWSPDNARAVQAWMAAREPRFAAQPVDPRVFAATWPAPKLPAQPPADLFEATLPFEGQALPGFTRFEVVRRRDVTLSGGRRYSWIHCRTRERVDPRNGRRTEWMFAGVDLPDWKPGSQLTGGELDGNPGAADPRALFLPGFVAIDTPGKVEAARELLWRISGKLGR